MRITSMEVHDLRFPTSKDLSGSDAVHKDPDVSSLAKIVLACEAKADFVLTSPLRITLVQYSCVYVVLKTDDPITREGYGLTFTLGRGNEVVCECVKALEHVVVGKDFHKEIVDGMMDAEDHSGFYYQLCQEGQLRWLGPEKGVIGMAAGAILNAVWDLMARCKQTPLWEFICKMQPEELLNFIDFKHIADYISKTEALDLLRKVRPGWEKRMERMKSIGFRAYTTSCGWLGYSEAVVREKCRESLREGHSYFKMKVGSKNLEDDLRRAAVIREEIGYSRTLMMDANQKWGVSEAIHKMKELAKYKPIWIEEPTHPDDVVGHQTIARALDGTEGGICGVATGEACSNKVLFKQLLQLKAIRYCQIDSCRVAGVSEILSILLMAAKAGVKVCPHAGGVGLCEYVRHLAMIDFVCFNPHDEVDRVCESVTDAKGYFYDAVAFNKSDNGLFYVAPVAPGYAKMRENILVEYAFPYGSVWQNEEKARKAAAKHLASAIATTREAGMAAHPSLLTLAFVAAAATAGYYLLSKRSGSK